MHRILCTVLIVLSLAIANARAGFAQPASFDATAALSGKGQEQITLVCTRDFLNELGSGGLLAAPVIYREP